MTVDWAQFGVVSGVCAAAVLILLTITAAVGFSIGRHNVVDVTWGLGFVLIAVITAILGTGDLWRRVLVLVMIGLWGTRLASAMFRRSRGTGEDPRYEKLLDDAGGNRVRTAITRIYATQGPALWFVSLPLQVSSVAHGTLWGFAVLGVAVWALGVTFETVGDAQMDRFRADPTTTGTVMDRGLWRYTRHPNYFGDACVWWGTFLVCLTAWQTVVTVLSPLAMTYFLVFATGARLLERHMAQRPGYREYQQRTSFFVPLPPRRG